MAESNRTIHSRQSRKHAGYSGVPRENIIDLRAARKAEMQHIDRPQPSLGERFFVFFKRRRTSHQPPQPVQRQTKERAVAEKVIVSHAQRWSPSMAATPPPEASSISTVPPPQPPPAAPPKKRSARGWSFQPGWPKRLAWFAATCAILILPIVGSALYQHVVEAKGTVLGISADAYDSLQSAGAAAQASNFSEAAERFSEAATQFEAAQSELSRAGGALTDAASVVPGAAKSAESLLTAGEQFSTAGADITSLLGSLDGMSLDPTAAGSNLTVYLSIIRDGLDPIVDEITTGSNALAQVRIKDLPETYREPIATLQQSLPALSAKLQDFSSLADTLLYILGHDGSRRYLLVFQNNRELRPTGGFMGSVALVDIYRGGIQQLEVPGGGIYDLAGQLDEKIIAPKPLWLVNPHWNIQDSNWFPDFPTAAQKMLWFLERAGDTSADGVLTLTPTVVERLLDITGPIEMPDYGVTITSENFVRETQTWAEVTYDQEENKPKKLISDLLPILLDRVFSADANSLVSVVGALTESLSDHSVLLYFTDETAEQNITSFGWDGAVRQTPGDYLFVVNTNIGGGKTDQAINQFVEHNAAVQPDGSVIDTVQITRAHRGSQLDIFAGQANVSYLRVYVPQGSELISADGFDTIPSSRYHQPDLDAQPDTDLARIEQDPLIDEQSETRITQEFGKTAFGNWVAIDPGEVQTVTISYRLPFTLDLGGLFNASDAYQLYVQRQPGTDTTSVMSSVSYPDSVSVRWASAGVTTADAQTTYAANLLHDLYYGLVLEK